MRPPANTEPPPPASEWRADLPPALDGLRIGQITDTHLGLRYTDESKDLDANLVADNPACDATNARLPTLLALDRAIEGTDLATQDKQRYASPAGVGPLAPVASNRTAEGRVLKDRRMSRLLR